MHGGDLLWVKRPLKQEGEGVWIRHWPASCSNRTVLGHGLYTEAIDLTSLGRLKVERATTITFDNRLQVWRVKDRTGFPLFTSPSREACLDWEKGIPLIRKDEV